MASHTFDGGRLTPNAQVIQLDLEPQEQVQGRKASDVQITADAISGTQALLTACKGSLPKHGEHPHAGRNRGRADPAHLRPHRWISTSACGH